MDFSWAEPYPELHRICVLFERTELCNPEKNLYQPLQSYLQNGPQCGLVALAMIMGNPSEEIVKKIYDYAKEKEYTYNGEIFSAEFMLMLAKEFLNNKHVELYHGLLDSYKIKKFLLAGGLLLVPYPSIFFQCLFNFYKITLNICFQLCKCGFDSILDIIPSTSTIQLKLYFLHSILRYDTDKDNSPGLYNGHKAHWCAISGFIQTVNDYFVIAKHGKSINVCIWKLSDLAMSNQQLFEFSPDRKLQNIDYKLPEGGISGPQGLNSRCILINQTAFSL